MSRKRRILILLAVLTLLCPRCALAALRDDTLALIREKTELLTWLMAQCAQSDAYLTLYAGNNDSLKGTVRALGGQDWSALREGRVYLLKEGVIDRYLNASGVSLGDFPPAVRDRVSQAVIGSIPTAVLNQEGTQTLAAAMLLRTGDVFLADEAFPRYALVCAACNDDWWVMCTFVKSEDNIVSASLLPVPAKSVNMLTRIIGLSGSRSLYEEYPLP